MALRTGPYGDGFGADPDGLTLDRLATHEHGLSLGPLQPRLPEVLRTVKLFNDVWADRATASDKTVTCAYNTGNDPNYTGRAWAAVLAYLLGDAKFLYE